MLQYAGQRQELKSMNDQPKIGTRNWKSAETPNTDPTLPLLTPTIVSRF